MRYWWERWLRRPAPHLAPPRVVARADVAPPGGRVWWRCPLAECLEGVGTRCIDCPSRITRHTA